MTDAPLRHGIVGTGFMATVHARAVRRAGSVVALVAGSTPERGQAALASLGAEAAAGHAAEVVTSPEVDVVHICTPNDTHATLARLALEAGKHVVCEKPLATDPAEASALAELASAANVVAAVPFVYRFYPTVRHARAMVARGEAGTLWLLHGSYLQDWLAAADGTNWRVDAARGGESRAFGDVGIHWCDLMEFVTGHRITALSARTAVVHPERAGQAVTTEDGASVVFETDREPPAPSSCPRLRPAARTAWHSPSTERSRPWRSIRSSRRSCGSAARTGTAQSCATPPRSTRQPPATPSSRPGTRRATRTASTPSSSMSHARSAGST
ncbi:Gfo/Idh/MocA family oxidoreductase [Blastococcus brunescens]|uniref:Gfo/Idh/MocA family oxidoreductase n=1 Tax=Blastococcus brunescens TaxID=1564165 RepID=A0ABZ1ATM7_9ACTN|nr:Gfo/Idh/MocA family oxidoreductase [Blastococcus sp. BMG 8361]WRL61932.1 Gfo/Idh/MocA family oxidoreductase [Blastococcus sp. BMG 8361]